VNVGNSVKLTLVMQSKRKFYTRNILETSTPFKFPHHSEMGRKI
jgi:hypothetical protein